MLIPIPPKEEWPEPVRAFYHQMAKLKEQGELECDYSEIKEDFDLYIESCNQSNEEEGLTKHEAKAIACRILATDCYHHFAGGSGEDEPQVKTEADRERLRVAFEELEREFERRGKTQ